jgi:hypothetical protein
MTGRRKCQNCAISNVFCRGASRSVLGRFTNHPYRWHDEIAGTESISDAGSADQMVIDERKALI